MMKILILILVSISISMSSQALTVDEWYSLYNRSCKGLKNGMVCKERLNKSLKKMRESIVPKMLKDNGLPVWLATVPIVESDYNNNAISKAGAIGLWQIKTVNLQTFYTKKTTTKSVNIYSGKLKFTEVITETKPTLDACKWIGRDPKISTRVAIWLLNKLYDKYQNWELALMAYNSGEPRLDAYLKGRGKPLAFETLNYYTQLLAVQKYIEELK